MNQIYRTIYNEKTGTFVAVAENCKACGKKSTRVKKIAVASVLGSMVFLGATQGQAVTIDPDENKIIFSQNGGEINFAGNGSITGLGDLRVDGVLQATQLLLSEEKTIEAASQYVVTGGQLFQVNQELTTHIEGVKTELDATLAQYNQTYDTRLSANEASLAEQATELENHGRMLEEHEIKVTDHGNQLTVHSNQLSDLENTLQQAGISADQAGTMYFRANSDKDDAQATGEDAVAIGPEAKAIGNESLALGVEAQALGDVSLAIGNAASAQSDNSLALGTGAAVDSEFAAGAIALGHDATVRGSAANAIAIGSEAQSSGANAVSLGKKTVSSGADAVAIGTEASGLFANTIALGAGASAEAEGNIVMGTRAGVGTNLGAPTPGRDRTNQIAIGTEAGQNINGNQTTSIGYQAGNEAKSDYFVAIGNLAGQGLDGHANVSIGHKANQQAKGTAVEHAVSVGSKSKAASFAVALGADAEAAKESLAIGHGAIASGEYGIALGSDAKAAGNSVALGAQSVAEASTGRGYLSLFNVAGNPVNVVAMGHANSERRLTHVAPGAVDTDAVNVSQLKAAQLNLAEILGNGVIDESGKVTAFSVGDQKYGTVAEALGTIASGGHVINPEGAVLYQNGSNSGVVNFEGADGTVLKNVAMSSVPGEKEAVNVAYLNEQLAEKTTHYFSVNSTTELNHNNQGAEGVNAMAIGPAALAKADSSIVLGHVAKSKTEAKKSVVIGTDVTAEQERSIVIGVKGHAYGKSNITLGDDAHSHGDNSIVIGKGAKSDPKLPDGSVNNAIAVGTLADVTADSGTAVGHNATASGVQGVAVGFEAEAKGNNAIALGSRADAQVLDSLAQGTAAIASGVRSQAQGFEARATATDGIALGSNAVSGIINPNPDETVNNINTIAIGNQSTASFKNAMATGTLASATHENAIASGFQAEATADNAMALGANAKAAHERAVALGDGAQTSVAVATMGATVDKKDYVYAGQKPIATVSVGSVDDERTITHVAAGRVSATSTDAINGSQLYGAHVAINELGDDLDTAGQSVADALGGGSSYDPNTHKVTASLNVQGNTYTTVNEAINYAAQGWSLTAQGVAGTETIKPGGTANFSAGKNIVVERSGNTITYNTADDVEFNQVNVDNSITIGDDVTNQTVINQGNVSTTTLTVSGETKLGDHFNVTNQGDVHYSGPITEDTHIVNKEYVDQAEKDLTTKGMKFVGNDGQVIHKDLGETLGIVGGLAAGAEASAANITTVQNDDGALEIQLAKNLTDLETIQVDNSITIGDDVTNQTVINQGNVSTTTLRVSGETKLGDHFNVTNQGDVHYSGPITNDTHIVNKQFLNSEINSAIDASGWHLSTGDKRSDTRQYVAAQHEVNLHSTDGNMELSQFDVQEIDDDGNELVTGQKVSFTLASTLEIGAKDTADAPQVIIGENGAGQGVIGITVPAAEEGQGAVTIGGGDVTIDWGVAGQTVPIAVGETLMKGMNFSGNNYADADAGTVVNKKFGERLEILGVDWIQTEVKDGAVYIKLADNFPVVPKPDDNSGGGTSGGGSTQPGDGLGNIIAGGDIQGGNNIHVKPGDDDYSLIIETTPDVEHNSVTVGDVVINQEGIHAGNTQITGVADGTQNDHAVNLGQLKDSIHQLDQDLTHKGMNFADSKGDSVHRDLGETLHIVGANDNITTQVDQKGILEIALSNDLQVDSITINEGGPIIDENGIDMSNKTITNVAPGVNVNDAVNVGQLHDVRDNLQGQVNVIRRDMHRMDRKLRGGVAAAMATASLPQAYLPGKSMMAIAGGTWAGESGMAIGYSGISDNGKWIMKLSGNSTARGDYGGAVGVGFQW